MNKDSIEQLIDRYLAGTCTSKERTLIERFYMDEVLNRKLPENITDPMLAKDAMWQVIAAQVNPNHIPKKKKGLNLYRNIAAAAAVLITVGLVLYFYPQNRINKTEQVVKQNRAIGINPGGNKATLTLSNGEQIILNEAGNGVLANQSGVVVRKTKDGQLVYSPVREYLLGDALSYNTISTPKGGQYQVTLPDGTSIWLNAATTVRFPTRFSGKERNVSLVTGEGYFEVAKNKKMPFRVSSDKQVIEVLGTHFNINNYPDEASLKTTLLEGSVRVLAQTGTGKRNVILKPGEQSVVATELKVEKADLQEVMAWKNNKFTFNSMPLEGIMRQISRWYNVDVEYKGDISGKVFTGTISRYANVTQVLNMLELTQVVHFKIKERRIIVMP